MTDLETLVFIMRITIDAYGQDFFTMVALVIFGLRSF